MHHVGPAVTHLPLEHREVGLDGSGIGEHAREPAAERAKGRPLTWGHVPGVIEIGGVVVFVDSTAQDGIVFLRGD